MLKLHKINFSSESFLSNPLNTSQPVDNSHVSPQVRLIIELKEEAHGTVRCTRLVGSDRGVQTNTGYLGAGAVLSPKVNTIAPYLFSHFY